MYIISHFLGCYYYIDEGFRLIAESCAATYTKSARQAPQTISLHRVPNPLRSSKTLKLLSLLGGVSLSITLLADYGSLSSLCSVVASAFWFDAWALPLPAGSTESRRDSGFPSPRSSLIWSRSDFAGCSVDGEFRGPLSGVLPWALWVVVLMGGFRTSRALPGVSPGRGRSQAFVSTRLLCG